MKKIAISTALKVYINFCPELGLENIPNMELLLEPTIEFFGSVNKMIPMIKNEIKNQQLSIKFIS